MQIYKEKKVKFLSEIECDICNRKAFIEGSDYQFGEFITISNVTGYASIFGDNVNITIDICQYCLKDKLGDWLRIEST